ncbi:SseB family protein [Butyrivibrio sp. YAB3001]|uniref:SseB family protein n=1 Tax=Butyrivibrio sp. YAB3001 TaxID=1520812 RepID=UPI0008F645B2|nr:SseB family protein [Butyrivibrio sp. YAB3001]SFB87653.1 SseB protein N-terminal domain-containing protein [Butyrivibrio sp. YAB3001]
MGLFNLFGGKKASEGVDEEVQNAAVQKENEKQASIKAHEGMEWPGFPKLNPVNTQEASDSVMPETVTEERKNEIGPMIYDEDMSPDSLRFLSGQELLFLLTALEVFDKKAPLPGFEKNHRKVYNELLGRIRDAEVLYVLYDITTGFPFVDHGFGNVYFEKETAENAARMLFKQFRRLLVKEVKVENPDDTQAVKRGFFDYLYYIGIENILVDNGAYRARFKRNEIVAAPGEWNDEDTAKNPINPALNFAMIDFLEELRWPVSYEKRDEVVRAKEMRMLSLIRTSNFIVPMQHEGPVEVLENGMMKFSKDTKFKFLVMNSKDEKQFLPVYTDGIEFSKKLRGSEWNAAVFKYQDILKFMNDKDGITINPDGQNLLLPKDRMMLLEMAGQQADQIKGTVKKNNPASGVNTEDEAVQKALNQAIARMNEKKDN